MAQAHSPFDFTGPIGNLSFYKRRDLDKPIARTKGGASKEKIKTLPSFDITRRLNSEFGGRGTATSYLMTALWPMKQLADYNIAGPLNKLIKPIQEMDTESEYGRRNIYFTRKPALFEGFNFNRNNPFDSIIRQPLSYTLSREDLTASIDIPAMIPGLNFFVPPGKHPLYGFVMTACIIPDITMTDIGYKPSIAHGYVSQSVNTEWYPVLNGSAVTRLEIDLKNPKMQLPGQSWTMLLAAGIRFGELHANNQIQQVKYAGAAKVVAAR